MSDPIVYSLDSSRNIRKSVVIYKHLYPNIVSPVAYISKPKHVSEEDFNKILDLLWAPRWDKEASK